MLYILEPLLTRDLATTSTHLKCAVYTFEMIPMNFFSFIVLDSIRFLFDFHGIMALG